MTRLPTPGGDDGTWGDILNAYLEVSHASDGTLNSNVVGTSQLQDNAVTNDKLDSSTQTSLRSAASAVQSINGKSGTSITLAASDISAVPTTRTINGKDLGSDITLTESDIANLSTDLAATEKIVNKNQASGYAGLDSNSKLSSSQLPSLVANVSALDLRAFGTIDLTGQTDCSAVIQSAIDQMYANGGGCLVVPPRQGITGGILCNVIIKPGVQLIGVGRESVLRANPGSSTPVIGSIKQTGLNPSSGGWAPLDPSRCAVRDLRIDGNWQAASAGSDLGGAGGASGRGLEFVSSNGDARWSIRPQQANDRTYNPEIWLENVYVENCGSDYAVVLGTNMACSKVRGLTVFSCKQQAMLVAANDSWFEQLDLGACGGGLVVTGAANKFLACKSWYHFGTTSSPYNGTGNGYEIDTTEPNAGNQFVGCESQDNFNYGLLLNGSASNTILGHMSGGDSGGALCLRGSGTVYNDIAAQSVWADRTQNTVLVVVDGTGGQPVGNRIRLMDHPSYARGSGWVPISCINGAVTNQNQWQGWASDGQGAFANSAPAAGGTFTPDASLGFQRVQMPAGNITIGPVSNALPGMILRFRIKQDSVGGRTITWDSSFSSPPTLNTAANTQTWLTFINSFGSPSGAFWECVSKV